MNEEINTVSEEQVLHNKLSFEINQELIHLMKRIVELQQENEQLKDNWNKLKEYLNYKSERAVGEDEYVYDEIYNEMQELKQGSDDNGQ